MDTTDYCLASRTTRLSYPSQRFSLNAQLAGHNSLVLVKNLDFWFGEDGSWLSDPDESKLDGGYYGYMVSAGESSSLRYISRSEPMISSGSHISSKAFKFKRTARTATQPLSHYSWKPSVCKKEYRLSSTFFCWDDYGRLLERANEYLRCSFRREDAGTRASPEKTRCDWIYADSGKAGRLL